MKHKINLVGVHEGRTCTCGHAAIVESIVLGEDKEKDLQYRVICKNCQRRSPVTRSVINAMKLWDQNNVMWDPPPKFEPKPDPTNTSRLQTAIAEINNVISDMTGEFTVDHLAAAESWDDRFQCLMWAVESRATVAEMVAWHRAKNGLDLFSGEKV